MFHFRGASVHRLVRLRAPWATVLPEGGSSKLSTLNTGAVDLWYYIKNIEHTLKPPVANRLMYGGEMKLMVVGGPNIRSDFHINMGEELFHQVKGDMNLDVIIGDNKKRIRIKEGEAFLLPAGIPHSPQRYAKTVGLVFERARSTNELDCMRWYNGNDRTSGTLYEEYFHCTDLGIQVKAAIENFQKFVSGDSSLQSQQGTSAIPSVTLNANNIAKLQAVEILAEQSAQSSKGGFDSPAPLSTLTNCRTQYTSYSQLTSGLKTAGLKHIAYDSEFQLTTYECMMANDDRDMSQPCVHQISQQQQLEDSEIFLWQQQGESLIRLEPRHQVVQASIDPESIAGGTGSDVVPAAADSSTRDVLLKAGEVVMVRLTGAVCGSNSSTTGSTTIDDASNHELLRVEQFNVGDKLVTVSISPQTGYDRYLQQQSDYTEPQLSQQQDACHVDKTTTKAAAATAKRAKRATS